jgi:SAM-dependent methyltransferase
LPYPSESFDLVTSTEVIEHLENPRRFFREVARVLKPGGQIILSTPNVLNAKSRVRYPGSGFFTLFGPLPFQSDERFSTNSHISPVSYFYLAHGLEAAGFDTPIMAMDKPQKTSIFWLALTWPFICLNWLLFCIKERRKVWLKDYKIR